MTRGSARAWTALVVAGVIALSVSLTRAQPTEFYNGRTLTLIVSFNSGGGADAYARLMARHLGRHIPGTPAVIVKNMPGAGGLIAANYLALVAPKDGSELVMFPGNIASLPLTRPAQVKYDVNAFHWIGSPATEIMLCVTSPKAPIKQFSDVFDREMVTGTAGTATHDTPAVLNGVLGTKLKLVSGYKGSAGLRLAAERNEIEGFCGVGYDALKPVIADGRLNVLVQLTSQRIAELPNIPTVFEFARNEEQRQILQLTFIWGDIARPIAAPPGTPDDRVAILRRAFEETVRDPAFLADAKKSSLGIDPVSGERIAVIIRDVYRTPRAIIDKAAAVLKAR
jgi:tripartite-type tricarboxylate transporter receptor subunit TctC